MPAEWVRTGLECPLGRHPSEGGCCSSSDSFSLSWARNSWRACRLDSRSSCSFPFSASFRSSKSSRQEFIWSSMELMAAYSNVSRNDHKQDSDHMTKWNKFINCACNVLRNCTQEQNDFLRFSVYTSGLGYWTHFMSYHYVDYATIHYFKLRRDQIQCSNCK